jgi:hypothetical protein
MAIRISEIKEMLKSYKQNGYLNIFINGEEGVGKTTFGTQLISLICKELNISKHIDMICYNYNEFKDSNFNVRYFANNIMEVEFMPNKFKEIKDNLLGKINIFEVFTNVDLDKLDLAYYTFKVYRGIYEFEGKKGRFENKEVFNIKDLKLKRYNEIKKNTWQNDEVKTFCQRIRREKQIKIKVLPYLNDVDIHNAILEGRLQFIFKSKEGTGKSIIAKPKRNYQKIWQLVGLYILYCVFLGLLIDILGIFSWSLYVIVYGIGCVIGWEIFIKPICREARK